MAKRKRKEPPHSPYLEIAIRVQHLTTPELIDLLEVDDDELDRFVPWMKWRYSCAAQEEQRRRRFCDGCGTPGYQARCESCQKGTDVPGLDATAVQGSSSHRR